MLGASSSGDFAGDAAGSRIAQFASASIGSQATASAGGTVTSTAACGADATVVPSQTITRRTSQAAPPASHVSTSPMTGTGSHGSNTPAIEAIALNSIATGTNGTTSTFAIGATRERRSKFTRMTGSVVSCAASVSATGSRIQPGHRRRRRSIGAPNQTRPAVASSESWKPTSHSTGGAASSITRAANARAEAACARDPPRRATSIAAAMSAARTTDGLAPVRRTYPPTVAAATAAVVHRPPGRLDSG